MRAVFFAMWLGVLSLTAAIAQERLQSMSTGSGRTLCGSCSVPAGLSSRALLASSNEPGQRLRITGVVYLPDGTTPAVGVTLFLYQTDASGHYNLADDPFQPRLRGWLRTDPDGRYEIETIKPGAYPRHTEPAHIHVQTFGPGIDEWFNDDFWFESDPLLTRQQREAAEMMGQFSNILKLQSVGRSAIEAKRDIRIHTRPR